MDINVDFNVNFSGNQLPALHKKEGEAAARDIENILKAVKDLKPEKNVVMELEDVQNFLYMLIGANLEVMENDRSAGNVLNLSA